MKWFAISGSWRIINNKVITDVEKNVKKIISEGNGIITGGALGVDYFATKTVLGFGDPKKQLKLYLPIKLDNLCKHFLRRAKEGIITKEQAENVISQWKKVAALCKNCIHDDWGFNKADKQSYFARNTEIIKNCDALYAFQVNDSEGVQDTIDKAKKLGKKVNLKKYYIKNQ